jgi:hypothetical protein
MFLTINSLNYSKHKRNNNVDYQVLLCNKPILLDSSKTINKTRDSSKTINKTREGMGLTSPLQNPFQDFTSHIQNQFEHL